MPWIIASLVSACFLGCYDLSIKHAVRDNAVLPVLFFSTLCGAVVWSLLMAGQSVAPAVFPAVFAVPALTAAQHLQLLLKSAIVASSWLCSYFAVKHLPVSIAAPIRATSPLWTLAGALLLLHERPSLLQALGVGVTLASFLGLSIAGRREGIHFHRDKWIGWLVAGTVLNAASSLYDKYLLGRAGFAASTVQAWFSVYLACLFLPFAVGWKLRWWPRHEFHWRWSIPLIAGFLLVADFLYFDALRHPDALISLVSSFRRGSTLVAFAGGALLFREVNIRQKLPAALGVLAGIVLTILG
jgi:transporter family protein